jgi:hypothetical protein
MEKSRLSNGVPVLVGRPQDGYVTLVFPTDPESNGHYPVVDGYAQVGSETVKVV